MRFLLCTILAVSSLPSNLALLNPYATVCDRHESKQFPCRIRPGRLDDLFVNIRDGKSLKAYNGTVVGTFSSSFAAYYCPLSLENEKMTAEICEDCSEDIFENIDHACCGAASGSISLNWSGMKCFVAWGDHLTPNLLGKLNSLSSEDFTRIHTHLMNKQKLSELTF